MFPKNKSGFSLIEIVIAMAISSIFAIVFYNAFHQTTRSVRDMNSVINNSTMLIQGYYQIDQDVAGMISIPAAAKDASKKEQTESSSEKKQEPFFQFKQENGQLQSLKFLTLSARGGYEEQFARPMWVVYTIKPTDSVADKKTFALLRAQEVYTTSSEKKEKASRAYPIFFHILRMEVTVFAQEKTDDKNASKTPAFKALESWEPEKYAQPIPAYIQWKGTYWDAERKRELPFDFMTATVCKECKEQLIATDTKPTTTVNSENKQPNALDSLLGKTKPGGRATQGVSRATA